MDINVTPEGFKEALGNETPAATAETPVTPQEGEDTPTTPTEEVKDETPADPPVQEHDWKKRFDGVDKDHKRLSEEHTQLLETSVKLVEKNPDLLSDLAETNPALADKVSHALHGAPCKDYLAAQELEEMKDENPERYAQEKRLRSLEEREAKRVSGAMSAFYADKGIKENAFDPTYLKMQEQLNLLNKSFVEENPVRALEIAHSIAFPLSATEKEDTEKAAHLAGNTTKKGGNMAPVLNHGERTLRPEAQAFKDKMRLLTGT